MRELVTSSTLIPRPRGPRSCLFASRASGWVATLVPSVALMLVADASAQWNCPNPSWGAFDATTASYPGTDGQVVVAVLWDPDGPGPGGSLAVLGGSFSVAGDAVTKNIMAYDWTARECKTLGSGISGSWVHALAPTASGDLLAGGNFASAGGVPASNVACWRSSTLTWTALGSGVAGGSAPGVRAILSLGGENAIVGGGFTSAGGVPASKIALWNGASQTWSPLGGGVSGGTLGVTAIAALVGGDVVVGGDFTSAGGMPASRIARWSPGTTAWSPMGAGMAGAFLATQVKSLLALSGGDVIAGGDFLSAGGVPASYIARWIAATSTWQPIGTGTDQPVYGLAPLTGGGFLAVGDFQSAGGASANSVALWTGGFWTGLGLPLFATRTAVELPDGHLLFGGDFSMEGGTPSNHVSRWDGPFHVPFGTGFHREILCIKPLSSGDVVVGGTFDGLDGVTVKKVARWNAASKAWSSIGGGVSGGYFTLVRDIEELPGGHLVIGGDFTVAGQTLANHIVRWDGSVWSPLGSGVQGPYASVKAIQLLGDGTLVAGGDFQTAGGVPANHLARWDGAVWSALGSGLTGSIVVQASALALVPGGDLIVGGAFSAAGGVPASNIARWNGTSWAALGAGVTSSGVVADLQTLPNGDVIVAGWFTSAGGVPAKHVARWNPTSGTWFTLGSGLGGGDPDAQAVTLLPNGDIVVAGQFSVAGGVAAKNVARWDGTAWTALGTGLSGSGIYTGVRELAVGPSGDLLGGGDFQSAGSVATPYLARFGCPTVGPCYPDCDQNGGLSIDDFICFQTLYALGDTRADCDASASLDIDDFICFQTSYAIGC